MNAPIRRTHQFSADPARLAEQVGELARDVYARTRYTFSEVQWRGVVTLGEKWRLDVGRSKPVAVVIVDAYDETLRRAELPGAVQWQWVNGQVQIDDLLTPFSGGSVCRATFLIIHRAG